MTESVKDRERVLEGTWEEIAGHGSEFAGQKVRLIILDTENAEDADTHAGMTFREIFAPVHRETAASGITEDELDALIEEARQEVWDEQQAASRRTSSTAVGGK